MSLQIPILSLVVDIEKAHRRVPLAEQDWGLVACSSQAMPTDAALFEDWLLDVNTVGTFGVGSAAY